MMFDCGKPGFTAIKKRISIDIPSESYFLSHQSLVPPVSGPPSVVTAFW